MDDSPPCAGALGCPGGEISERNAGKASASVLGGERDPHLRGGAKKTYSRFNKKPPDEIPHEG